MNSTHHELSFELLHVGWNLYLQIFEILFMSGNTLSWGALTQQLAPNLCQSDGRLAPVLTVVGRGNPDSNLAFPVQYGWSRPKNFSYTYVHPPCRSRTGECPLYLGVGRQ